jgi:rhodanese-related sulfurtransferase
MAMTGREMVEAAQQAVPKMPQADLKAQLDAGAHVVVLDVREGEERASNGYLAQATWIARGFIEGRVENTIPDKETPIVTH